MNLFANPTKITGKMKPMHAVGQPPLLGLSTDMIDYLRLAGIPFSRLHDVGGAFGGCLYVDIPNIFRDFSADPEDENSYDFAFTDWLIKTLVERDIMPIFRLGVTIENYYYIKAYRIFPPADYNKWAKICEMIVRHYNEGWANGFHFNIQYWEIWNEPDNNLPSKNQMWTGTMEEYFELYRISSRHLKSCFRDKIKVGGYASCGFYHLFTDNLMGMGEECLKYYVTFFEEFLKFCKENACPLDFFSWHSYIDVDTTVKFSNYVRRKLDEYGFTETEHMLNEWNNHFGLQEKGSGKAAAGAAAMMCALHKTSVNLLAYYDARCGVSNYSGMFSADTRKPYPLYYSFMSFNELYKLGYEIYTEVDNNKVKVLGAADESCCALLIANETDESYEIDLEINNRDYGTTEIYLTDVSHNMEKVFTCHELSAVKSKANSVLLIKFR